MRAVPTGGTLSSDWIIPTYLGTGRLGCVVDASGRAGYHWLRFPGYCVVNLMDALRTSIMFVAMDGVWLVMECLPPQGILH